MKSHWIPSRPYSLQKLATKPVSQTGLPGIPSTEVRLKIGNPLLDGFEKGNRKETTYLERSPILRIYIYIYTHTLVFLQVPSGCFWKTVKSNHACVSSFAGSSKREVKIRVPFSVVNFSRGTPPIQKGERRAPS